jgi:hypothetical protein
MKPVDLVPTDEWINVRFLVPPELALVVES